MTNSINSPLASTESTITLIAQNLCNQLIEFQNSITLREEGQRFPGIAEVTLIVKLINCLDKLRKFLLPVKADKEMRNFINYLKQNDDQLAKIVSVKYKEYSSSQYSDSFANLMREKDQIHHFTPSMQDSSHASQSEALENNVETPFVQHPVDPGEYSYDDQLIAEKAPMPEYTDEEKFAPITFPLLAELRTNHYTTPEATRNDPDFPDFFIYEFDDLITREDLDEQQTSWNDYIGYWELINDSCTKDNKILINSGYYKYHVLQYKLRYMHYMLQLKQYYSNNKAA